MKITEWIKKGILKEYWSLSILLSDLNKHSHILADKACDLILIKLNIHSYTFILDARYFKFICVLPNSRKQS